jgi:hypothetical protein
MKYLLLILFLVGCNPLVQRIPISKISLIDSMIFKNEESIRPTVYGISRRYDFMPWITSGNGIRTYIFDSSLNIYKIIEKHKKDTLEEETKIDFLNNKVARIQNIGAIYDYKHNATHPKQLYSLLYYVEDTSILFKYESGIEIKNINHWINALNQDTNFHNSNIIFNATSYIRTKRT